MVTEKLLCIIKILLFPKIWGKKKDFKRPKASRQLEVMEPEGLKIRELSY